MNLFIQIQNGQPVNYPAFEDNLIQAYGAVPEDWEPFVRSLPPVPNVYEVLESSQPIIQKIDGVWTDVWPLRPMTADERLTKQQNVKDEFARREFPSNWTAWEFNEQTCKYEPPIPFPGIDQTKLNNGVFPFWCGAENIWKEGPPRPKDGKNYKFDFLAWAWVEVTQ